MTAHLFINSPHAMQAAWSTVSPQIKPVAGDGRTYPSVRYSACAVGYKSQMVITHGYHYNHEERHPAWKSDAWSFGLDNHQWRMVHEGEAAGAPSARYSTSCVLWDEALYMYGGDDGGHKYSMNNYVFGAHFSEMWRLDLRSFTWKRVQYANRAPPKRALHAAVVFGNSMYVYGGLELSDTWRFDFMQRTWEMLVPGQTNKDQNHPGRRHALMAAAGEGGFYLFGGAQHGNGLKPRAFNDLYKFTVATNSWSKVDLQSDVIPAPRSHHSLVELSPTKLLLYGGALCIPGCKCYGDLWVFDAASSTWSPINASNAPIHRYRQSLVRDDRDGSLYLFGGESYRPYMYHNAVNKLVISGAQHSDVRHSSKASTQSTSTTRQSLEASNSAVGLGVSPIIAVALLATFIGVARWWCKRPKEYHPLDSLTG